MPRPRAVVFDMDGLMFNSEDVYLLVGHELLGRRGVPYTQELADAIMGRPPQVCFETMIRWHALGDTWQALSDESEAIFLELYEGRLAVMPGLMELLNALEIAGIPKAICTSSSRRIVEAALGRFGLGPRFRFALAAEDITRGKPDPEIYLKAAARLGVAPGEMLVLEDSQTGCRAAAAAGAVTIAVPGAHSASHDFSTAALVANGLSDPRIYESLGLAPPGAGKGSAAS